MKTNEALIESHKAALHTKYESLKRLEDEAITKSAKMITSRLLSNPKVDLVSLINT